MQSTDSRPKLGAPIRNTIDTFWAQVEPTGFCWLWQGYITPEGYGMSWLDGDSRGAHRIAYTDLVGEIPNGMHLDHLCRIRNCVNPDHLEIVTPRENSLRATRIQVGRSHCTHGHEWTEANTLPCGESKRCRQCILVREHVQRGLQCAYDEFCDESVHGRGKLELSDTCERGHTMADAYIRSDGSRMCSTCITDRRKSEWANMPKVTCECGAIVGRCNLKAHTKTGKHKSAIRCRNEPADTQTKGKQNDL